MTTGQRAVVDRRPSCAAVPLRCISNPVADDLSPMTRAGHPLLLAGTCACACVQRLFVSLLIPRNAVRCFAEQHKDARVMPQRLIA